jgi:hypothetical protein
MEPNADREPPPVPAGTRLLHIGPHKTGTTSLQAALWTARESMTEQGVRLAGRSRNPVGAARAVVGQASSYSEKPPPIREWRQLVHDVERASEPRVVVSSEFFAHADEAAVRRIVMDLDPSRLHVVVTLRPLARIIPSMWQQNVQAGKRQSLDRWLHTLFPEPGASPNASFWTLHRHDELVRRWASVVGTANITAVVVDEGDHAYVLRAFESLLGLRPGTLVLERDLANRSLTYGEAEAVRAFDVAFRKDGGDRATHARVMRYGAAQHMKGRVPGPTEGPIALPAWAIPRISETGRDIGDHIAASGIRVIGDLSALAMTSAPSRALDADGEGLPDPSAPPAVAAAMSLGILHAAGVARRDEVATTDVAGLARTVPSYLVAGVIATRTQVAAVSRWRGARRQARRVAGAGRRAAAERLGEPGRYGRPRSSTIETRERMEPTRDIDPVLLPEGTRLLHIGPPKTGTTALQGAFHAARAAAEAQGVHYAGRHRHSMTAVQAVLGRPGFYTTEGSPPISHWRKLADEVRGSKAKRVVLSSEFFADATPEAIRRVVDDLDASRLHVVVTLRPLSKIIPSQWQQYVQSNLKTSFDDWLDAMFGQGQAKIWPSFWNRHRHDRLIARWAEVVGADRMTVVALDDADHDFVLRAFERLTGLTTGTLVSTPDVANRSLTMPEAEAVRAFNIAFGDEGLGRPLHSRVMNFGAARYMRQLEPPDDAMKVETPQWALDKAGEVSREMVDAIAASGVRVIGDLEPLATVPRSRLEGDRQPVITVPPAIAARMAMGVLYSSGLATPPAAGRDAGRKGWRGTSAMPIRGEPIELVRVPTRDLLGVLVRRGRASVRRRLPGGAKPPA